MKIPLDKYYTPTNLAKYCISALGKIECIKEVTHIIEPSAGNGSFSRFLPCDAYDIQPDHPSIVKQDFLELNIPYLKGRLVIGNPPFGRTNSLIIKFFKKSVEIADTIAFILPVSQYGNKQQLYEFDLVHSEILPKAKYSGVSLDCCFNVYQRPLNGVLNKRVNYK